VDNKKQRWHDYSSSERIELTVLWGLLVSVCAAWLYLAIMVTIKLKGDLFGSVLFAISVMSIILFAAHKITDRIFSDD